MYELNRVRLFGIGPRGARYNDVTLDLSDAGPAVPRRSASGVALRPSPASLLLLENGGGKSVLLTLLFSVIVPGKRNTMGGTELADLHAESSAGHVAIEWLDVATGDLLITGKVSEHKRGSSDGRLEESWYALRPSASVTLETLPLLENGRRRGLKSYQQALQEAEREDPQTRLNWNGRDQGAWRERLHSLGIPQDLYEIQRAMNVDEGAAATSFSFKSAREFIDWLLVTVRDEEVQTSLGEAFHTYAGHLAQREVLTLEHQFLEVVVSRLDDLAQAASEYQAAVSSRVQAQKSVVALADALEARCRIEQNVVDQLEEAFVEAEDAVTRVMREHREAEDIHKEILLRAAKLGFNEARQAEADAGRRLSEAVRRKEAWELLPLVDQHARAQQEAADLARQMQTADQSAAEALRKRDEAAGKLIAKYLLEASAAEAREKLVRKEAEEHERTANDARAMKSDAEAAFATARTKHETGQSQVAEAEQHLDAAIEAGLVDNGVELSQVAALTEQARLAEAEADECVETARATWSEARAAASAAREAERAAVTGVERSERARDDARERWHAALETSADLLRQEPVQDLIDASIVEGLQTRSQETAEMLSDAAERICAALQTRLKGRVEERDRLNALQLDDGRVLAALDSAGILPPRQQAIEVVDALNSRGIVAHTGWEYLERAVRADLRHHVIMCRPAAVDGVVILDPNRFEDARQYLHHQRILPDAAIWVGPATALTEVTEATRAVEGERDGFVVDPTPALYDTEEAERRREDLAERISQRAAAIAQIERENADTARIVERLQGWARDHSVEKLRTLHADVDQSVSAAQEAHDALSGAEDQRAVAEQAEADAETASTAAEQAAGEARTRHRQMQVLDSYAASALRAVASAPEHLAEMEAQAEAIHRAERDEASARTARDGLLVQAQVARDEASRHRSNAQSVPSTTGKPAVVEPDESLASLVDAVRIADDVYRAVQTNTDLKARLETAQSDLNQVTGELAVKDPEHVAAARTLRDEPSAADKSVWQSHATTAREEVERLGKEAAECTKLVGQRESTLQHHKPPMGRLSWTNDLPDRLVPSDSEAGTRLAREQSAQVTERAAALETATSHRDDLENRVVKAKAAVAEFASALELLADRPEDGVPDVEKPADAVQPFSGDGQAALRAARETAARLRDAKRQANDGRESERAAVGLVTRLAQEPRFEALADRDYRRLILMTTPEDLAQRASSMAAQLRVRQSTIAADLTESERHRGLLVDQFTMQVQESLRTIHRASKLSTMPEELAGWGGRRFLRIGFTSPNRHEIQDRVAVTLDRLSHEAAARNNGSRARTPQKYDGSTLLLECVHAAVPAGFRIELLHPDPVLRDGVVPIEKMSKVFSGGQELTAAIVLYCTLAALKADDRGNLRRKHSGVLFLDNPIGKASAGYLIDVQKGIARALGVQLVYTTGLNDDAVLAAFNVWIRLRNDADLRAGIKHIRIAQEMRQHMPEPYSEAELASDDTPLGTLTAARVARRPDPEAAERTLLDDLEETPA